MKIFLIGLMGSGKTFLGREVAKYASLPFLDLDAEIEKQEGQSVSNIFSTKGEEYFRTIEAASLRTCNEEEEFVMATGGGTPCFHNNMDFILQAGTSIFIDTPMGEILARLSGTQKSSRPLLHNLSDGEIEKVLVNMRENRLLFYKRADFTINGATATAKNILQLINSKK